MIEKYFWQIKIKQNSRKSNKKETLQKDSSNIIGELEFNIVSGFYIIRKLIEHNKLTKRFISKYVKENKYPLLNHKKLTPFNEFTYLF